VACFQHRYYVSIPPEWLKSPRNISIRMDGTMSHGTDAQLVLPSTNMTDDMKCLKVCTFLVSGDSGVRVQTYEAAKAVPHSMPSLAVPIKHSEIIGSFFLRSFLIFSCLPLHLFLASFFRFLPSFYRVILLIVNLMLGMSRRNVPGPLIHNVISIPNFRFSFNKITLCIYL
jgi:hypothetical protein